MVLCVRALNLFPSWGHAQAHLIGHDHELSISQAAEVRIVLVMLKTHDLLDILDLLVLHDLIVLRLAHVEKLAAQREDAKVVAPDDTKPGHCERLGRVSFGQDERALGRVARPGIVRIRELGDAGEAAENEK
jgi:hypothetical protein